MLAYYYNIIGGDFHKLSIASVELLHSSLNYESTNHNSNICSIATNYYYNQSQQKKIKTANRVLVFFQRA
jgi:hypothetical protein